MIAQPFNMTAIIFSRAGQCSIDPAKSESALNDGIDALLNASLLKASCGSFRPAAAVFGRAMKEEQSVIVAQIPFQKNWIFEFEVNEHSRALKCARWKSSESSPRTCFKKIPSWMNREWIVPLKKHLETGCPLELPEFQILHSLITDNTKLSCFQKKIYQHLAHIRAGRTVSYAELAAAVGVTGAARAVGNAMRKNPWPLFIPCHRVLRSDGSLGFYAAPQGQELKAELLKLEGIKI